LSNSNLDVSAKLVELLRLAAPNLSRMAVLGDPASSTYPAMIKSVQAAAQRVGVQLVVINAGSAAEIDRAFASMARDRVGGVVVAAAPFFSVQRRQIAELTIKQRLPSINQNQTYAEAGGLMSYGSNTGEEFRRAAVYVDKILKGAKPGDLPVEQPTTFDLVINNKTAKMLGITIPQELLLRAAKVIE
jgi:putative ABC transport system substrate-binding protein